MSVLINADTQPTAFAQPSIILAMHAVSVLSLHQHLAMYDSYQGTVNGSSLRWAEIAFLATGIYVLWTIGRWVHQLLSDPLRDVSGPPLAKFTRFWLLKQYAEGRFQEINVDLHKKYGSIVRVAPNNYSVDDPEAVKAIYAFGTAFVKSDWYSPWGHPEFLNLFNVRDPKTHAMLRRQLSHAYSMSSLVSYEPLVDDCVAILSQRLSEFAVTGTKFNMGRWLQCFAFDMIGKISFSYEFGFLDAGVDIMNLMQELDGINLYSSLIGVFPFWHTFVAKLVQKFKLAGQGTVFIDKYTRELIKARAQQKMDENAPVDFVMKFLNMQKQDTPEATAAMIRNAAGTNMVAGSDTTSISLSAVLYNLCRNPVSLAKLRMELKEQSEAGKISDPITFQEAQALPYLQAVIKEALRVHPATGFTMPRVVPAGGATISGRYFPQGTVVGINAWVAHANTSVFGEDAHLFRPERWLESKELCLTQDSYYFTFGQGSRMCIGKNISMLEITKSIPQLVRKFDFELVGYAPWNCTNRWFVKPTNFICRVRELEGTSKAIET